MGNIAPMVIPGTMSQEMADAQIVSLKRKVAELRASFFPPDASFGLVQPDDTLPIWLGSKESVRNYHLKFKNAFDIAHKFYPQAALITDCLLPARVMLPQFRYDVTRLVIIKNEAKESKTFDDASELFRTCGEYSEAQVALIENYFETHQEGSLVCHRHYVDFRARTHRYDVRADKPVKKTLISQFYSTGLVIASHNPDSLIINDSRLKETKPYKNAYRSAIADNGTWKVFVKKYACTDH